MVFIGPFYINGQYAMYVLCCNMYVMCVNELLFLATAAIAVGWLLVNIKAVNV